MNDEEDCEWHEHETLKDIAKFDCKTPKCPGYHEVRGTGRMFRQTGDFLTGRWFIEVRCPHCDNIWGVSDPEIQKLGEELYG